MTKKELINEINKSVSAYLGFKCETAGLTGLNKEQLAQKLEALNRAVELKNQARQIQSKYTRQQFDYFALVSSEKLTLEQKEDYTNFCSLSQQASEIWLKN